MYFKAETVCLKTRQQAGYSLLELSIVVLIMGVIAVVMTPSFSSSDPTRLDKAAQLYAEAIRYARAESMRGSKLYGFKQLNKLRRISIKSVDQSTTPWSLVNDVNHPISKKKYRINLGDISSTSGITTKRSSLFRDACNKLRAAYFDRQGSVWCIDPNTVALQRFDITLQLGALTRVVSLDGPTGRVTIQ